MTIKTKFIDREDELAYIKQEYKDTNFKFISIIGRRRVGKTRLIEEFIKEKKNASYFLVQELDDLGLRMSFAEKLHRDLKINFLGTPTWDDIFKEIFMLSETSRIILIFDEFQRFLKINKSVPSILQGYIDKYATKSKLFLIVTGSSIGMMHRLFDYTSALYGRRTGQITISPLKSFYLNEWFSNTPLEKIIEIYSVFGGTPKYLEDANPDKTLIENIKNKILDKRSILYIEPEILIKTELSESSTYMSILKLISEGKTKSIEIADSLSIKTTSLTYFLNILEKDMGFIKKEIIVTEKKERPKKVIYKMNDPFFKFWFRYIYPYKSDIEIENTDYVVQKIENNINSFIGYCFEDVCKEILLKSNKKDKPTPFKFSKIGSWWGHKREDGLRKELEIDIVALNENTKEILFCECKWQKNVDAKKILNDLKEKSKFVEWNNEKRKEHYAVFAKSFKNKISEPDTILFDLKDLENSIK